MEGKIRLAVFGQKRLSREGGIEIVVKELCTRMHIRMFPVTVAVPVPAQWSLRSLAYITASSRTILN